MQITIERAPLMRALSHVSSVVEKRGTIPVLSNVKLEASGDILSLTATDMDLALVEKIPAQVKEPGAATVPAHMFYDIARKLPDGADVNFSAKETGKAAISAGSSKFTLSCLPVEEFPVMAEGEFAHRFRLASSECKALIEKPGYAMSTEETRYYLNGIYLHVAGSGEGAVLRAVATDGHRLARVEVAIPAGAAGMPGIIIPRKAIQELRKLLESGEGEVEVSVSEGKIRFVVGEAVLVSKLIEGQFPDYERVIPANNQKMMELECRRFKEAVDRVSVISSERTRAVRLSLGAGTLGLAASSAEAGSANEEIDVTYGADPLEIGFNSRYLLDMLGQIEGDTAQFLFNDPASPVLVRDTADVGSLYVIMPMRV